MKYKPKNLPVGAGKANVYEHGTTNLLSTHFFGENEWPEFYLGDADQYTVHIIAESNEIAMTEDVNNDR